MALETNCDVTPLVVVERLFHVTKHLLDDASAHAHGGEEDGLVQPDLQVGTRVVHTQPRDGVVLCKKNHVTLSDGAAKKIGCLHKKNKSPGNINPTG